MPVDFLSHRIAIANTKNVQGSCRKFTDDRIYKFSSLRVKMFTPKFILLFSMFLCLIEFQNKNIHENGYNFKICTNNNSTQDYRIKVMLKDQKFKIYKQITTKSKSNFLKCKKTMNKEAHSKNGNINKFTGDKGLKLFHWNKGNAHFQNKISELQILIQEHDPDILCISEANLKGTPTNIGSQFKGYICETNLMHKNVGISRNILFIKRGIPYKRRSDLENKEICTIWIEIKFTNKKKLLLMGGYRQWTALKECDNENTKDKLNKQIYRWGVMLKCWELALSESKDTVVMMDDNIDSNPNDKHNKIFKISKLFKMLQEHVNVNNLCCHNNKFTRFVRHQPPSCIDHIYSNCPHKIYNVNTIRTTFSDHAMLICCYKMNKQIYTPKFINVRDRKKLTEQNLLKYINANLNLSKIFRYTDPNLVAEILQIELNSIIEIIAPTKKIQVKKNFTPYLSPQTKENLKKSKHLLNQAIEKNEMSKWTEFKNFRNQTTKEVKEDKKSFFKKQFLHHKKKWQLIKELNGNCKKNSPDSILHNGTEHTSPKQIAQLANEFFINKILKIRETFTPHKVTPLEILSLTFPRNTEKFNLPLITPSETLTLIRGLKSSNATGHDSITNKILKTIAQHISPHITHLINCIIRESKVPTVFKTSRITAIPKSDKPPNLLSSLRPINNLVALDKLMEEHILRHLTTFLNNHDIIHNNHHGGTGKVTAEIWILITCK